VSDVFLIADNLNSADPVVHAALAGGDRAWIEARIRALAATGVDALDLHVGTLLGGESAVLEWVAQLAEAVCGLPLFLDSMHPEVLRSVGQNRASATWNSIPADHEWSAEEVDVLTETGADVVLQLRRAGELPTDAATRSAWRMEALEQMDRQGLLTTRTVYTDAVMLPWAQDFEAGAGLLEFLAATEPGPRERLLVGLSNVGYGAADPSACAAAWWPRLRAAGLGAALVDAAQAPFFRAR
jgi:hypothetical protein